MASKGTTLRSALRRGQLLIMFACCAALCGLEAEAAPAVPETVDMQDASEFGHIVDRESEGTKSKELIIAAVNSNSQSVIGNGISDDTFNPETDEPIILLRRGFKDTVAPKTGGRTKRWTYKGSKWPKKDLTYRITNYTTQLDEAVVDQTFAEAFAMWSEHTDLTFSPKSGRVDIEIGFVDGMPEDPDAVILFRNGEIYFNDDKVWTRSVNGVDGYNLLATALYATGGILGLGRSDATSSVRNPNQLSLILGSDDIEGIQALYGPKTAVGDVRQFCADPRVDAILLSADGHRFVFKGENYWELTDYGFVAGYPKLIGDTWNGLSGNIDFAYTDEHGETYFQKGSKVWRYIGQRMMEENKVETPAIGSVWNSFIEAQKLLHSSTIKDFCLSDSIKSLIRSTKMN